MSDGNQMKRHATIFAMAFALAICATIFGGYVMREAAHIVTESEIRKRQVVVDWEARDWAFVGGNVRFRPYGVKQRVGGDICEYIAGQSQTVLVPTSLGMIERNYQNLNDDSDGSTRALGKQAFDIVEFNANDLIEGEVLGTVKSRCGGKVTISPFGPFVIPPIKSIPRHKAEQ
jgi:starvation-inducible outer membrane lipoprotein